MRREAGLLYLITFACGVVFGLGLTISQMINPAKVLNFLDVAGEWDPTLALVFAGAIAVALPAYQGAIRTRKGPVVGNDYDLPASNAVTPSLVGGAALFGIGWGLAGFCPGPGLTSLATLLPGAIVFVIAMFAGAAAWKFKFSN